MLTELAAALLGLHRSAQAALSGAVRGDSLLEALALAAALGALHALTPGHGKAVIAAYFLGHASGSGAALASGFRIAAGHVGLAVALVAAFGAAATAFGQTAAAAAALETFAYGVITATGAWMLASASRRRRPGRAHGLVTILPGLIPCPLTMLVFGFAMARADLATALAVVLLLGIGIAVTLSLLAVAAWSLRRGLLATLQPRADGLARVVASAEIVSATLITAIGLWLLIGSIS